MKRFLLTVILLPLWIHCSAQLLITDEPSAAALAQKLVGPGISITNVSFTGNSLMAGYFKNLGGTNLNLDSGIVLTTGSAKTIPTSFVTGLDADGTEQAQYLLADTDWFLPGDATLATTLNANLDSMFDACVLEFDFIPSGDTVKFRYVFSSEEYTAAYVCNYNDAFAFYISGPGIAGVQNIALIPGTNIPVSIINVNEVIGSTCVQNSQYFYDNIYNTNFTHDGQTVALTAFSQVQPCNTYHLRLVIADFGDGLLDSGVFLESKSFTSNEPPFIETVSAINSCGGSQVGITFSENILCSTVQNADFSVTGPGGALYSDRMVVPGLYWRKYH
ncbi:MAG: choice-of-anchor L domain-containing protein [Ferruginibacter sp.]